MEIPSYKIICEIGHGAYGKVYLAEGANGRVALKVCNKPEDSGSCDNWEREQRGWMLLRNMPPHPGIVRVFDVGFCDNGNAFWVAMELADAEEGHSLEDGATYRPKTLASLVSAEIALPISQCLDIAERLASALEHLQRHHLLHRDIKPGNILICRGRPVLADAGLVVDVREAASLVGTTGYVPPENYTTHQGDVYSLGCTLWRICTGRTPEEAGMAPCIEADITDPDFREFLFIVDKAMSRAPSRRYQSAKALRKALKRLKGFRSCRHIRKLLVFAVSVTFIFLVSIIIWLFISRYLHIFGPNSKDPLNPLREGMRSGKIHMIDPNEVQRDINRAMKNLNKDLNESVYSVTNNVKRFEPPKGK